MFKNYYYYQFTHVDLKLQIRRFVRKGKNIRQIVKKKVKQNRSKLTTLKCLRQL